MKRDTFILCLLVIVAVALVAASALSARYERATLEARLNAVVKESRESLDALSAQNKSLADSNALLVVQRDEFKRDASAKTGEIALLKSQRAERDVIIASLREQMQSGPLSDVLSTTRTILATDEVALNSSRSLAEFSLAAFRKNASALVEWREFSLVTLPSMKKELVVSEALAATLNAALSTAELELKNKDTALANDEKKFADYERIVAAQADAAKARKRSALKKDIIKITLALALGYFIGK
jgi:hypothetical protein